MLAKPPSFPQRPLSQTGGTEGKPEHYNEQRDALALQAIGVEYVWGDGQCSEAGRCRAQQESGDRHHGARKEAS